jgi:serine/threonine-protein kinase
MRHVREDVPDVQLRRADVAASTAAVVDRATAKDLTRRYPDIPALVGDLEEALAIEAARSGQATGEVTSVLRTLRGPARRRLPWRMRHPARWAISLAVIAAGVAGALVIAAGHTHRGITPNVKAKPGLAAVVLGQSSAHSYNPFGTGPEHRAEVSDIVDGDPNTSWSTEHYLGGAISGKPGLGIFVDAAPGVVARAIAIQTPTPGFTAAIYAAQKFNSAIANGDARPLTQRGWKLLVAAQAVRQKQTTIDFATAGTTYRFYLLWITKLPVDHENAEISELTLFR